ncbi:MAG: hypothetical protein ACN4E2_01225 [Nitrospinota bacterium]
MARRLKKAYPRVKLICSRLGGIKLNNKGSISVEVADLIGKSCYLTTEQRTLQESAAWRT